MKKNLLEKILFLKNCICWFNDLLNFFFTGVVNLAIVEIVQLVQMSVLMSCLVFAGIKWSILPSLVGSNPPFARTFAPVPTHAPIQLCIIVIAKKIVHPALPSQKSKYRVFHSDLIYFESLDDHQICNSNIIWRLPYKAEMRTFMKM